MRRVSEWIPIVGTLQNYSSQLLTRDLIAGATVGVMLIPQGMAYADLAGMPPIFGLFSATVPLLIYGIMGTSKQLAIGPVAIVSLLIASGISQLAQPGSPAYISLVLQLAVLTGIIQLAAGVLRLGFLANFLSRPVIHGFASAAALIIITSQLGNLLGISVLRSVHPQQTLATLWNNLVQVHWITVAIGVGGIVLIWGTKRIHPLLPGALIALVVGATLTYFLDLSPNGVKTVGTFTGSVPPFRFAIVSPETLYTLLPTALAISMIGFLESFAVAKALETKSTKQRINANREFLALGSANLGGSLFSAFPVAGGFARSAVNAQAGASSGVASIVSATVVFASLMFLTPLFTYIPSAVLAAIILVAVSSLIGVKDMIKLWRTDKRDFTMLVATFFSTLALGVELGISIAVILSLVLVIYSASNPHSAVLGRLPSTRNYVNIERFPNAKTTPGILVFRFDGPLFFANVHTFADRIKAEELTQDMPLQLFILDASAIHCIDSSAMEALSQIIDDFSQRNIYFCTAFVKGPVRDSLQKSGLLKKIGKSNIFMSVADATDWFHQRRKD